MKLGLAITLFVLFSTLGHAKTIYVPGDYPEIQDAITAAVNGDTVQVAPGLYTENIDFLGKDIIVMSSNGSDYTTIDGNRSGHVVTFQSGEGSDSIIEGFTIVNGGKPFPGYVDGGGIFCSGSSPVVRNCVVSTNEGLYGGGIYCHGASPRIELNLISWNVGMYGAGIACMANSSPTISKNEIKNNSTNGGPFDYGGGIYCDSSDPIVLDNVIYNNSTGDYGGGIACVNLSSPTISNNLFQKNTASVYAGGGVCVRESSPVVTNNIFLENAAHRGGALYFSSSPSPVITNNTVYDNSASGYGGGIYCEWFYPSAPVITNTILWKNQAPSDPEIGDPAAYCSVKYCNVEGGWPGTGNIDADPQFEDPYNSDFHIPVGSPCCDKGDNAAPNLPDMDFEGDPRIANGIVDMGADEYYQDGFLEVPKEYPTIQSAIDAALDHYTVIVTPGTYCENIDFKGKAIVVRSDGDGDPKSYDISPDDTMIDGSQLGSVVSFKNNEGLDSVLEGFTIRNGSGTYVTHTYYGGGIYCESSSPTLFKNKIIDNNVPEGGGGVLCWNSSADIKENTISQNGALYGAGIAISDHDSCPTISDNVITKNTAIDGAGIHCWGGSSKITDNLISENTADMVGGGIHFWADKPVVTGNIITKNFAGTYGGGGGGIHSYDTYPTIVDNEISMNSTNECGGGILCEGSESVIANNDIHGNVASKGGGIYCSVFYFYTTISNNTIYENEAGRGGGILCFYADPDIITNNIYKNKASTGGGIYCRDSFPTITNNLIWGNSAYNDGGGIYCLGSPSAPVIVNSTLFGNSAGWYGGGIYCREGFDPTVKNTILWNNTAPSGPEIWLGDPWPTIPANFAIDYSNVDGGQASVFVGSGCTLNWGSMMINQNPLFADALNGDLHLTWLSPCINRGNNAGVPAEDLDGDPRIAMGTVDMGADEFIGIHPLESNVFSLSKSTGGLAAFNLNGGPVNAGRIYIMVGSITGTAPGIRLPGGKNILPLNWDVFTDFVIANINSSIFVNFMGNLDFMGVQTAEFNTLGPLPSGTMGLIFSFAFALGNPWDFVSNPINIEIVP